ncbi:tannase/feruloyl esterase family alpha/beta hydrolase [Pseudorhodoferax sp. Leaf274]|uniref:tannase/feruloyl esterase family alpha/beta hydrolase n=1 Tax=Pseudorhodoferax sp. Leaf274 TaxID=1736318 RepID=UPI00070389CB|nr:tannase/feruloyl esterase family alpha/beta hydrolase [Pseudorhodoferax sp. Leaf274]KQP38055.1 hypothetical protein ASF44_12635 [Pseudorhodoferax sp. Leaf274]
MRASKWVLGATAASVLAACGGSGDGDGAALLAPQQACEALAGGTVAATAIGLPTSGAVVQSARFVAAAADNPNGEHCQVKGLIMPRDPAAPNIEYEVNLPSNWNGKALQYGGGGYNGTLVTGLDQAAMHPSAAPRPLARGYATLGSDSGHKAGSDAWALNDEALANFGHQQIKKTRDVAAVLAQRRYGRAPERFYFVGNSQGGHEALDAAARYPADYDGVVATHPAYNVPLLHLGSLNVVQAGAAGGGAGWLNPAQHRLVKDLAMATCDGLDGQADGIISHLPACRAAMTVDTVRAALRCPGGAAGGDGCLSDAQIAAVARISSPYRPGLTLAGASTFGAWGLLEGADLPLGNTGPEDSFFAVIAATTVRYVVAKDPALDLLAFDPLAYAARLQQVSTLMDVTDVSLEPFRARGGKIIMTHGTADQLIPSSNSVAYYERQRAQFGQATLDGFLRFYMVPGFAHGGGTFSARYDALAQLENWVERGQPPQAFVTVDENAATAGRTRHMCLYGSYPRLTGAAANDAASYTCTAY